MWRAWKERRRIEKTVARLMQLDDRLLKDMGLARDTLVEQVREEVRTPAGQPRATARACA